MRAMRSRTAFERVARLAVARGFARPGRPLVVAVSGGADSIFLLHALAATGARLHVAHLDHGLRGERGAEDARFVAEAARALSLPLVSDRVSVPELRARRGGSIEEVARRARYDFLARVARTIGADRVALGHTADDQAETVLFRLLRGAGPRGLRGMPRSRRIRHGSAIRVVRPLLRVRRCEIEATLAERGIAWRDDETNADLSLARNWIRRVVLPALSVRGGDPVPRLLALARCAARAMRSLDAHARRLATGDGSAIDAALFASASPALREAILRRLARSAGATRAPGRRTQDRVATLAQPTARTGAAVSLGADAFAIREPLAIRAARAVAPSFAADVPLRVPGETPIPAGVLEASIAPLGEPPRGLSPFEAVIDADRAGADLVVGAARAGDRLRPLGAPGGKPLRRLFTDWKVPAGRRPDVPIVRRADGGIVWVVGHRIADDVRVTGETKRVLRLVYGVARFSGIARSSSSA
jgi:tRNA(Ile)-lysidine synthase